MDGYSHLLIVLAIHLMLFTGSSYFFARHLYRDFDLRRPAVQHLFSLTFTTSVAVVLLPLLELLSLLNASTRLLCWRFDICILIGLVYIVIPTAFVHSLCVTFDTERPVVYTILGAVTLLPSLWLLLQKLGGDFLGIPLTSATVEHLLARMAMCGVAMVSALAGFGSVHYPYQSIRALVHATTSAQVYEMELRLIHTLNLVAEKKQHIARLRYEHSISPYTDITLIGKPQQVSAAGRFKSGAQSSRSRFGVRKDSDQSEGGGDQHDSPPLHDSRKGGWRSLLASFGAIQISDGCGGGHNAGRSNAIKKQQEVAERQCNDLGHEILSLEELCRQLFLGLHEAIESRGRHLRSSSLVGRVNDILGWMMTCICVYRVLSSVVNVMMRRVVQTDPATATLTFAFEYLKIPIDVTFWSPYASLLLLGAVIILNIRGFLDKVLIAFRHVSTAISSNVLALLAAEAIGIYFAACALLMRIYLPEAHREVVTKVLGPSLDYVEFHLHFDLIFSFSCFCALALLTFAHTFQFRKFKTT